MADVTTEHLLRYAVHDSTTQVLTEPSASKVCVLPAVPTLLRPGAEFANVDRSSVMLPNGEHVPDLRGVRNANMGDLVFEMAGLGGGGAGDGDDASDSSYDTPMDGALGVITGATDAATGGVSAASPGSGTTYNVASGDGAGFTAGRGILIRDDADNYHAREVVSRSTDALTINAAIVDELGASATFASSEECFAARTYIWDNDQTERSHLAFFSEHDNDVREFLGCMPAGASLGMAPGSVLQLTLAGLMATKINTSLTSGAGSYSAPTQGDLIVNQPQIANVGGYQLVASQFGFDFGLRRATKMSGQGPQNTIGFVLRSAQPTLSMRVLFGALTSPQELTDAIGLTWAGSNNYSKNTLEVFLQVGNQPGATMLLRLPAARLVSLTPVEEDGLRAADLVFKASESGNHSNVPGACRLHVF